MSTYSEFRFYSPMIDQEAVRLSMCDERRGEYFMVIPAGEGKAYRERRDTALEAIYSAIRLGLEPGEVRIN